MTINKLFKATDKLGKTYLYAYLSTDAEQVGCRYIHLYNVTMGSNTDVEYEWFNQRVIIPLRDENGQLTCRLEKYIEHVSEEGKDYFKLDSYYLNRGTVYKMVEKEDGLTGLSRFIDEAGNSILIPTNNLGSILPYVASEGLEYTFLNVDKLFVFNKTWSDMFGSEDEGYKPTLISLNILINSNSQDMIDKELHNAYNNWMYEECNNSILLDEGIDKDELMQIPVCNYLLMWLDRLNIVYVDLTNK